jgi:hypothetical protein
VPPRLRDAGPRFDPGFVEFFGDVRSAHHHRYSHGADRISHAIGLGDHPGHRPDSNQSDILIAHEFCDVSFIHRLCVAINQHHFVTRRRERLEEEHP